MNDGSNQLTPCRDCQNPCSSSAKSCPKCGCDDPTGKIAEAQAIQVAAQVEAQQKIVADLEAQQEAAKKTERRWTLGCIGLFIFIGLSTFVCVNSIPDDPDYVHFDERLDNVNKEREKYGMAPLSPREYSRREKGWSKILPPK